jgi:two-component system response regulator YesN
MMFERVMIGAGSFYEDMREKPGAGGVAALTRSVTRAIEQSMDVMEEESIEKAITGAVSELASMDDLTGKDVRNFAKSVHDAWLAFALQYNVTYPGGEKIREEFLKRLDLISSADGIYAFLKDEIMGAFRDLKAALGEASGRPVTHAKQYIKEHFSEPLVIDDIAEREGFNSSYFSTLFKKITGVTFSEYLRGVRMNEAKRLLKETNLSVAVICNSVGYNDIKHFSSSFRKATGVKPSEYRKLYSWG